MSNYNLDNTEQPESFMFTLGGHDYSFRYPTTEELTELANNASTSGTVDLNKVMHPIYALVSSVGDGVPSIDQALGQSRIQVFQAFQKMVQAELGLQDQ